MAGDGSGRGEVMTSSDDSAAPADARSTSAPRSSPATPPQQTVGWLQLPPVRHPNEYVWFVFFSALDIMLTWAILKRGGQEVNPLAHQVISAWGLNGAIVFKFTLTIMVVLVCEITARQRQRLAHALAVLAMIVSGVPVFYSLGLLMIHTLQEA